MEFNFNTESLFKCDKDGIALLESNSSINTNKNAVLVLNKMGEASSLVSS
jgi:hypothetical protein